MLKSMLSRLEDPNRPLLGPNYWILSKMGLILPRNRMYKTFYIILHDVVTIFVITQYMELYAIRSNLDLVITNLKTTMLSTVCIVKLNTCIIWQDKWVALIEYITTADLEERKDIDPIRKTILKNYTRYCRIITYFYWVFVFLSFIAVTDTPLMLYLFSNTLRENLRNGTEQFPHILSSWMPFDKYTRPGNWLTVAWHTAVSVHGAGTIAAYDISAVVMMVFFGGKLDLLKERCKLILGKHGEGISDQEAKEQIRDIHYSCLRLNQYAKIFNSLLSPVMFLYVVMCSVMLAASAYQLTSVQDTAQRLLTAEYMIFGVGQLFMFCWHSTIVFYKSEQLAQGAYESAWCDSSVPQRKSLNILISHLRNTIIFTAGPFTNLTLNTFITILKGAYSYYTLLRT